MICYVYGFETYFSIMLCQGENKNMLGGDVDDWNTKHVSASKSTCGVYLNTNF